MPPAITLPEAAGKAFDNLQVLWFANNLKTRLQLFCRALEGTFPDSVENNHPVRNWLAIIGATAQVMPASNVPIDQLSIAANYVYRLCWMTNQLNTQSLISSAQAATLLGQYNTLLNV